MAKTVSGKYITSKTRLDVGVVLEEPVRTYGEVAIKKDCRVGHYTYINSGTTLYRGTSVGRFCSIGRGCEIGYFEQPMNWLSTSPMQYNLQLHFPETAVGLRQLKKDMLAGPVIGHDVWVGNGAVIRRNVTIGHGAIIAPNTVVNGDVPPFSIVEGSPSVVTGFRFDKAIIKRLLAVKWWDLPVGELQDLQWDDIGACLLKLEAKRRQAVKKPPNLVRLTTPAAEKPTGLPLLAPLPAGEVTKKTALEKARALLKDAMTIRQMTPDKIAFFEVLLSKFEERGVGENVFAFLKANQSKVFSDYDLLDSDDAAILNNKVDNIASLYADRPVAERLTPVEMKQILRMFQSRH